MSLTSISDVVAYAKDQASKTLFSFHIDPITDFISHAQAIDFGLTPSVQPEEWNKTTMEYNKDNVLLKMRDYLKFAFEKAEDQRGLSAMRSLQKMQTFLVILGDREMADSLEEYDDYGMPHLKRIDEKYFEGKVFPEYKQG